MDSIRPDEDELRAREPITGKGGKATVPPGEGKRPKGGRNGGTPPPPRKVEGSGGSGRGVTWFLVLLLLVGAGVAGWFGWHMQQKLSAMENQLEEADYWSRQSKLALARFEGDLSETGENLEETGSSMEERLTEVGQTLGEVNDEIRKLWVLANDKNRPRIEALGEQQEALSGRLETLATGLSDTEASVVTVTDELDSLSATVEQAGQRQAELATSVETLEQGIGDVQQRVASLVNDLEGVDERVNQQLTRFRQEQSLTIEGLESRIQSLESGDGRVAELSRQLSATRSRLSEAEQTLESVDASRAQLTSRLVRLQQQVDQLRAQ